MKDGFLGETEPQTTDQSKMSHDFLRVQMLGGFSLIWKGKPITLERTNRTKTMRIFQMLLYEGISGAPSERLMEVFFSDEHVTDPANNLKVTVSHLRRTLKKSGLDQVLDVRYNSGGYYLDSKIPIVIDYQEFLNDLNKPVSNQEERLENLLHAESLYGGEFLPHLNDRELVMVFASSIREKYFACVRELARIFEERQEWSRLLPIAGRAATRYHHEEWHCLCVDCLINMGQVAAAWEAYKRANQALAENFSVRSGGQIIERLRRLEELEKSSQSMGAMIDFLQDSGESESPYYCNYSSFIDLYRVSCRVMPHRTKVSYLVVYSFADRNGERIKDQAELKRVTQILNQAIAVNLRSCDVYTRYGKELYLLLLIDIDRSECEKIVQKIQKTARNLGISGVSIRSSINKVGEAILPAVESHRWEIENFEQQLNRKEMT